MNIFPGHSLLLEEFAKVRSMAEELCQGSPGRNELQLLTFSSDYVEVLRRLEETDELRRIFENAEPFPDGIYPDITRELQLLAVRNAVLSVEQVLMVAVIARRTGSLFSFFIDRKEKYPLLSSLMGELIFEKKIVEAIDQVIDETGQVLSTASPELSRIRKQLARKRIEAEQLYLQVIQKYRKNGWLTDAKESWRGGRRVISIFAEQKRSARGIIHDISATGKTCFIEPEEAMGINNILIGLEEDEKLEIQRIIRELTLFLSGYSALLRHYFGLVTRFDTIQAKAALAVRMKAALPYVDPSPQIRLIDARHPLLFLYNTASGKPTIPFNLSLAGDERILVISGPNAGGKTVCMKTAGLLQLMLQAGFLITADGNSRFGIFREILVDIGDSQSLEFELSTYSSRLKHMKVFMQHASADTLFLIDEFGTGTDPALGGALAESILEELNYRKSIGIITTHYMNLKVLADRTPGIINGCMVFDAGKLEPRYKLEVGKPGSSYTFVVAERSGLPYSVINRARKKVKKNTLLLDELLNKVEHEKSEVARLMELNRQQEKKLQELVNKYERNLAHQEKRNEQHEERIRQKELKLSRQLEDKFTRFVKDWKEAKNKKTVLEKYNRRLQDRKKELSEKEQVRKDEILAYNRKHVRKGAEVRLTQGRVTGVVESVRDDQATVFFGNVKTVVGLDQLFLLEKKKKEDKKEVAPKSA